MSPVALAHHALVGIAAGIEPVAGDAAVAAALVLLTVAVRVLLLPLAVRVARADLARRALAPGLEHLRNDPRELAAAYRRAGVNPFAGLLPALAQAPVMVVVYRLCVVPAVAGAPSVLRTADLFGAPLAMHGPAVVVGLGGAPALVVLALLAGLVAVAWTTAARLPDGTPRVLRVVPFGTVAVAMFAPLALAVHLLTSTAWTLGERTLLPRLLAG